MFLNPKYLATAAAVALSAGAVAQTTTPPSTTTTTTESTTTTDPATTTAEGQPATTTTQTTTTEVTLATEADLKTGASVFDQNGELLGTVESVSSTSAVVNTGKTRAEIPLASFGKNDKGLVLGITKADLDAKAGTTTTTETKTKTKTKTETKPDSQ